MHTHMLETKLHFCIVPQHDLDLESMTEQELRAVVKKRLIACINDAEWLDRMDCGLVKLQVVPC